MGYYAEHLDGDLRFKSPATIRENWQSYTQHIRTLYSYSNDAKEHLPDDVSEMGDAEIIELLTDRMGLYAPDIHDPLTVAPDPELGKVSSSYHIYSILTDGGREALLFEPGGELMFMGEDYEYFGVEITEAGYILTEGKVHWSRITHLHKGVDDRPADSKAEGT